jgi:general secretion pathway protein A
MYKRYFGLKEKPFHIAPSTRFLYLSELHREALVHLLYGINGEGCIILLTGEVGTGKTMICRSLIERLPETTDIALILNPNLTITDLLQTICEELHIAIKEEAPSVKNYIDSLNRYLLDAHARGRNTALIIDEAQNLDMEILEQLRLLTNLETDSHKLLQIVLIGQPELLRILDNPKYSQINQRITTRYHLEPLQPADVTAYITHRITMAGGSERYRLFSKAALRQIIKTTKGVPRLINVLCDRALLGAYAENRDQVDLKILRKAAREIAGISRPRLWPPSKGVVALAVLLLALLLPTALYLATHGGDLPAMARKIRSFTEFASPIPAAPPVAKDSRSGPLTVDGQAETSKRTEPKKE